MTVALRAREALADCDSALSDFQAGANSPFQRSRWVAVMTLLRTVGLVLKDVDRPAARATPDVQRRMDDAWKRLKAEEHNPALRPHIFHDFIDAERYQAVHLYEIRSAVNVTIRPGAAPGSPLDWAPVVTGGLGGFPTMYDFFMKDGPFKGRDPLDLCRDAIEFWRQYLDAIEGP